MTTTLHALVTTATCVRGCTRLGMHHGGCGVVLEEPEADCRGCMPRGATDGLLCWPCYRRLHLMLTDLPWIERWLEVTAGRTAASALREDHEMRRGGEDDGAPAPVDLAAIDHRETLRIALDGWVEVLTDHSVLVGPDVRTAATCAAYLLTHLDRLADMDFIDALWADVADLTSTAHAIAPWRPTAQRVPHVPCPECQRVALVIFGGDEDVTCTACRAMIPPGRYGIWVRIFEAEHRAAEQAQREVDERTTELLAAAA